jgi:hypothetical protein
MVFGPELNVSSLSINHQGGLDELKSNGRETMEVHSLQSGDRFYGLSKVAMYIWWTLPK